MRYTSVHYAFALLAALKGKTPPKRKEVMRRFLFLLRKHGVWARRGRVFKEIERQELKASGFRKVRVESAAPLPAAVKREIKDAIAGKTFFEESVNPDISAGIKILVDEELLVDASARSQISRMFAKK